MLLLRRCMLLHISAFSKNLSLNSIHSFPVLSSSIVFYSDQYDDNALLRHTVRCKKYKAATQWVGQSNKYRPLFTFYLAKLNICPENLPQYK